MTSAEAAARLRRDGPNRLPEPRRRPAILRFGSQLVHFFALMLWGAVVLALVAGMVALGVAIAVVVVLTSRSSRRRVRTVRPSACGACCRPASRCAATAAP